MIRFLLLFIPALFFTEFVSGSNGIQAKGSPGDSVVLLDSLVNHYKITNNAAALKYAHQAMGIATRTKQPKDLVIAYKLLGIAYYQNQKDSSYYFYTVASGIAEDLDLKSQKIIILYDLAALYNYAYNYKMAITFLDSSIRLAEQVNRT